MDPLARGRETWTLIPSFAERRMSAGLPISLLDAPVYHTRSEEVRRLFASADPQTAWNIARDLDIDYLYLSQPELARYPEAEAMLTSRPDLFQPVFRNQTARIFRRIG
jgi:uncharacterized membrane protein